MNNRVLEIAAEALDCEINEIPPILKAQLYKFDKKNALVTDDSVQTQKILVIVGLYQENCF